MNEIQELEQEEAKPYMTDDELVSICMEEASNAIGGGLDSENESDITMPIDYYLGRLPGVTKRTAKDPNASTFVSMDVMDAVEATVAEIMPSFTTDEIGVYLPSGEGDEEQAELETTLVNYLFFEEYDGWTLLQEVTKDALLHRNCTAKAFWDERAVVEYEEYKNIPAMALHQIMQPNAEEQEVEILEQEVDGQAEPQSEQEMMMQQQGMMPPQETFTIKIKRTTIKGKPVIKSVAPEETIVGGDHDSPYLHNARFCGHELIATASDMIEQGYDPEIIMSLPEYNNNIESLSRNRSASEDDYTSAHESTKLLRIWELYPLIDFDGDGIAERRLVVIAEGNTLLKNEPLNSPLLIGGVATLMPHKYKGISLFERIKQIQDTKTPMIRSIVDGTQLASNPRLGVVGGKANLDDLMRSRTGGIVRMKSHDAVIPLANPEVPMSAYTLLEMMDKQRAERGGGAVSTANTAQQAIGQGGDHSMERIMSAMELANAMIARSLGETIIRGIFIQLHDIIRTNLKGEISARIGGQWVKSVPSEWQKRANVSMQIGSSNAERARRAGAMEQVIALQRELAQTGSVMFSEDKAYKAMADAIKLKGIKSPELYLVDPSSEEGMKGNEQKSKEAQEKKMQDMQMQMAMAKSQMELARAENTKAQAQMISQKVKAENDRLTQELNKLKAIVDAGDKADNTQFDYDKLETEAALRLTELEQEYQLELNKQYEQNKNQGVSSS